MTERRAIAKGVVYFGCTLEFMAGCTQARCWPLLLVCCEATKERDIGGIRHVLCTLEISVGGKPPGEAAKHRGFSCRLDSAILLLIGVPGILCSNSPLTGSVAFIP